MNEKEAIVYFKNYIKVKKEVIKTRKNEEGWIVDSRYTQQLEEMVEAFETVLNFIEKCKSNVNSKNKRLKEYAEELEKKDKIIDKLAFSLADYIMYYDYDKCRNPEMIKNKAKEEIEYFTQKIEKGE